MRIWPCFFVPVLCAQSFEVASIKPHPGEVTVSADPALRGLRVTGTASTLVDLITNAYGIRYDQISGGPKWINEDHFDVDAKVADNASVTPELVKVMMRHLLEERFQLKVRRETRQVPVYALVAGNGGVKLRSAAPDAQPGGFTRGGAEGIHREVTKGTMKDLAEQLSFTAGRPVVDKTGLAGFYAYTLDWFPANRIAPVDSRIPSMFVAVREQLGLRLLDETGTEEYLVIERAERPSAN
jgi:uncharacterized protein (TIGR03435 family)